MPQSGGEKANPGDALGLYGNEGDPTSSSQDLEVQGCPALLVARIRTAVFIKLPNIEPDSAPWQEELLYLREQLRWMELQLKDRDTEIYALRMQLAELRSSSGEMSSAIGKGSDVELTGPVRPNSQPPSREGQRGIAVAEAHQQAGRMTMENGAAHSSTGASQPGMLSMSVRTGSPAEMQGGNGPTINMAHEVRHAMAVPVALILRGHYLAVRFNDRGQSRKVHRGCDAISAWEQQSPVTVF